MNFCQFFSFFSIPLHIIYWEQKALKIMNSWDFHEIRTKTIRQKYWNALKILNWINCFSAQDLRFKTSTPYKVLIWEFYHDPNIIRKFSQKSFDCSVYKSFMEIAVEILFSGLPEHFWKLLSVEKRWKNLSKLNSNTLNKWELGTSKTSKLIKQKFKNSSHDIFRWLVYILWFTNFPFQQKFLNHPLIVSSQTDCV